MRVEGAINIADLRALAKRRLPKGVFDYVDGGADDELTLRRNVERFSAYELIPDCLVDVSKVDTKTTVMGAPIDTPIIFAPTAASRMFHVDGESAVAATAQKRGTVYCLSTLASTTMEDVAKATGGPKWLQVYVWKDRGLVREILARAKAAGFTALVLTVDMPVAGNRERDPRNRFTIPPSYNVRTIADVMAHPSWMLDVLTSKPVKPALIESVTQNVGPIGKLTEFFAQQFDQSLNWKDAEWFVKDWSGPVAIKGVMNPADAVRSIECGARGIFISNHGGRQLGAAPATIDMLPAIAEAVDKRIDIVLDGGIRRGTDVVTALALGAKAVALGRAYLWGLSAGGQTGVERAFDIVQSEFVRSLILAGCPDIRNLSPRFVRQT
ncbi:MAG: alpha-hydroxy acid oxidase [Caulobacterales bacterium]